MYPRGTKVRFRQNYALVYGVVTQNGMVSEHFAHPLHPQLCGISDVLKGRLHKLPAEVEVVPDEQFEYDRDHLE